MLTGEENFLREARWHVVSWKGETIPISKISALLRHPPLFKAFY